MSTASKTSKSSLVNSLAKRYDPKVLQNQGPIASQKTSQTNPVSKDIKSAVNITTMDIKMDSLCQKIDSLLMEQDNVLKKLENISQDVFGIEKDLETIKSDNTKTEQVTEKLQDKENMLEMKELFSEMVSNLSSINKYAEQQAKRLDGVEQILLGTQSFVRFVMEEIRLPAIFDFLQNRPNTVKPPNNNINEKAVKKSQKEKGTRKGEKCVKDRNSSKKSKKNLQSKKKYKVTKNQKANQKKTLYLSCKGTASLKQEPPDSERSMQRTQLCTQKEKVQKLNKENTEKTTVILVESISTESQAEEISNLKRCISIDIPISRNRTPIEGDAPIIFSEESDRQSTPINADNFQSSTGVSNEDEGTEECFSKTHQCTEEKELSISVSEDEETVNNEDGKEDKKDDNENDEGQDEKESTENETSKEETEPLVVTEEDSELSENERQAISASDKPQEKTQVPKTVGDISTECTDSSHSDTENTVLKLAKEDNEVSVDLIQNGENGYHEHSCSSKRVADEDQVKDDNKKSRVDTQATGQIISAKSAEETIVCLVISTEEPQTSDSTQDCTEQPSLKEETRFVLDSAPPPPAPFDHRIVSAKHAQINSFYSVENTEVLGTGRFGQVHSCVEKSSGLRLAAKVIKVRGHKEKEEVKNEIQVMNQLNHTNLIQLYDAFESRNDIVLVMEFVEGGELFDRIIDENCNLSEVDTILYIKQICEGIQYMHQMYIIHLDLKPENIMCVSRAANQIKIIDFGLARRYKPREKLKVHFGTPEFLAPEVVNYDFVSFPTDMWSVGVIAYMLLSGLSPFLGEDDNETLNNILACQWDFEGEEFNNISEVAKDFIIKLLVKEKCWRMSATESLKHSWLSDPKLHFKISQKVETDSLPEATVGE